MRTKRFSLAVDRASRLPLGEQLFLALKEAIARGVYKPGERLPGLAELARTAGASEKVARRALARLAEIGWCESRRGTRSVVANRGRDFRGHVLFYLAETVFGFHAARLVAALRSQLLKANYRLTAISADDLKKDGSSRNLSESLQEHWDLVIEMGTRLGSRAAIERAGWPFLVLGDGGCGSTPSDAANYVGRIGLWSGLAVPEFVAAFARRGVRSVVQFLLDDGCFDVAAMLAAQGIACTSVSIHNFHSPFRMYRDAYAAMANLLKPGVARPDVILFTDDHFAQGGLLALMERGVRVPEDVRVVTHANRGLGPFWIKPLTRLEMDPVAQGRAVARTVLSYFRTGHLPEGLVLGSVWQPGETF